MNFKTKKTKKQFVYTTCSELGIFKYWTGDSMNNLMSYCGLNAKIRASDNYLPVKDILCLLYLDNQMRIHKGIGPFFLWTYVAPYHRSILKQIATLFCSGGFILVPSFLSLIDILFSSSCIKKSGLIFWNNRMTKKLNWLI